MDIVGGVRIADPTTGEFSEAKIVSGIDDHSRFVISAKVVARATSRPVCDALEEALARHGLPEAILSDNGKVFTARFGPGLAGAFRQDLSQQRDQAHPHQAPLSDHDREGGALHKTLRAEFLNGKVFASIEEAQEALDAGVYEYNHTRPHQGIGNVAPFERFRLAAPSPGPPKETELTRAHRAGPRRSPPAESAITAPSASPPPTTRPPPDGWPARPWRSPVRAPWSRYIHRGVLIATHARRHPIDKQSAGVAERRRLPPRAHGHRCLSHPQGRHLRQCLLRRHHLSGRPQSPPPAGPGGRGG